MQPMKISIFFLVCGMFVLTATGLAWQMMRNHMTVMRLSIADSSKYLVTDLGESCAGTHRDLRDPLTLLRSVAVPSARISYEVVPASDFVHADMAISGKGAVAPQTLQLALLCHLRAAGLAARLVSAVTTPLTSQHMDVVETRLAGHWILLDPVLDAVVQDGRGNLLGSADIRQALYNGGFRAIGYHSFAPNAAVQEESGNDQLHKFHYDVVVTRLFGLSTWQRVPPMRFLDGAHGVIERSLLDGHNEDIFLQQWIYALVVLFLPLTGILLMLTGILFAVRGWRQQND